MGLHNDSLGKKRKTTLVLCNLLVILFAVAVSVGYARRLHREQMNDKREEFISTVESMKSVSQNYLDGERGYVVNWSAYITDERMDLPQALEFLRRINTNPNRYAHIVDMDTLRAWSAGYPAGQEEIDTYSKFAGNVTDYDKRMNSCMREMFDGTAASFSVVGKYRLPETLSNAVSVGARVTIQTENGPKDYLLLRAIPTDILQRSWVFPAEYQSAEVGIITRVGEYVVQSPSMRSENFLDYIRAYNFQDDYNRMYDFADELAKCEMGVLHYKNFRGQDCLWYFSSFGEGSKLDIVGCIPEAELLPGDSTWILVLVICGSLTVLVILDGMHLLWVNRRLRETARLARQSSEAKTNFLSAMSHDIRTPMNAVLSMTAIAQRNLDDPEYASQCLGKAANAGRQLLTLINDVLDISKIESGKFVLTPTDISLPELISGLQEIITPQAQEKGQQLTYDVPAFAFPWVNADPIRLNQIYINLLSNAVKYTPPGGSISVSFREEPADESHVRLIFRVSDTGIGMSPEFQKHMYQSFARAVSTQVNRTQGSGLGLSIARQMVELMDGTIDCESQVDKGTTFTVTLELPVVRQADTRDGEPGGQDADVSGLCLLVAEDNDMNWEIVQILLEECGDTCRRAENGRICLDMIAGAPAGTYDAILMDVQMPEMTGLEAARRIRQLSPEQNGTIPIVAMTADAFAEDVQACLASGMNGHIAKPVDVSKLRLYLLRIKNHTL